MFNTDKLKVVSEEDIRPSKNYNLDGTLTELDFIDGEIVTSKIDKQKTVKQQVKEYEAKVEQLNGLDCMNCLHYSGDNFCNHYEIDIYDTTITALGCQEFWNFSSFMNT